MGLVKRFLKRAACRLVSARIPFPAFGVGCGVLGMVCARRTPKLGEIASRLLEKLEYRGYDSTGLCIQDPEGDITLKKAVGSPSRVVRDLEMENLAGRLFCGQVRWATFGVVDDLNAQPHLVSCKERIYGAHNGNITNCERLKDDMRLEGHVVVSDNDGEMLVHVVEHFFFLNLEALPSDLRHDAGSRRGCMARAIRQAGRKIEGSYAAVVADPVIEEVYAIKCGSSLYVGKGVDESGGEFVLVSSDLSAVLSKTRVLIPISEGEFVHFTAVDWTVYSMADPLYSQKRAPKRSKLRNRDTMLHPPFQFFMEQEIAAQADAARSLVQVFFPENGARRELYAVYDANRELAFRVRESVRKSGFETEPGRMLECLSGIFESEDFRTLDSLVRQNRVYSRYMSEISHARTFSSEEEGSLQEVNRLTEGRWLDRLLLADSLFLYKHQYSLSVWVTRFAEELESHRASRVHVVACGSSYNAARVGSMLLNKVAGISPKCYLPGEFRSEAMDSVTDDDLFVGVSQSGETKDLVDICNSLAERSKAVRLMVVNNVNSTLPQEKCAFYLPILCGPEIAVPATKSYTNQVALFFGLALKCLEIRGETGAHYQAAREQFEQVPQLLDETLKAVRIPARELAAEVALSPSLHVLATGNVGLSREGALKIREVVLNHCEGMEASEFKHGPNTILGKNFTYGIEQVQRGVGRFREILSRVMQMDEIRANPGISVTSVARALEEALVRRTRPFHLGPRGAAAMREIGKEDFYGGLFAPYPILFLTPPTERDVRLTISQINTHKIRGTSVFVIAEEHEDLMQAASRPPADTPDYRSYYLVLPRTDSDLLFPFSAMVAMQTLALEMSVQKMKSLNHLRIPMHGVHPDVPKNVSKSITVD